MYFIRIGFFAAYQSLLLVHKCRLILTLKRKLIKNNKSLKTQNITNSPTLKKMKNTLFTTKLVKRKSCISFKDDTLYHYFFSSPVLTETARWWLSTDVKLVDFLWQIREKNKFASTQNFWSILYIGRKELFILCNLKTLFKEDNDNNINKNLLWVHYEQFSFFHKQENPTNWLKTLRLVFWP